MGGVAGGLGSYADRRLSDAGLGARTSGFLSGQLAGAARGQLGQLFGSGQQQPIRRPSMGSGVKQAAANPPARLGNASAPSAGGSKDWSTFRQYLKTQGLA